MKDANTCDRMDKTVASPVQTLLKNSAQPQVTIAVRLHHLWRRALMENPGEESIKGTEAELDFSIVDDRSAHFDRFWRETFDELQLPEPS